MQSVRSDGEADAAEFYVMLTDITAHKHLEQAEVWLGAIVNGSQDAIIGMTLDGTIISWNQGAGRMFGYTSDEILDKSVSLLVPSERLEEEEQILAQLQRGERVEHYETLRRHKDGRLIDVSLTISPIQDGSGRLIGASKVTRDITERKRAETAVRVQVDQYKTLLLTTPEGFWLCDTEGNLLDVNEAYCRMSGYSREELLCLRIPDLELLEKPEETARHIQRVIGSGFDRFESQHRRKDGSVMDVEISVSFLRATGQLLLFVREITSRKQTEEELATHRAQLEEAQAIARLGSWNWDIPTNTLTWSAELYRIFELRPEEFGATHEAFLELLHPEDRARFKAVLEGGLSGDRPYDCEVRIICSDCSIRVLHTRGRVIVDQSGKPLRMFGTAQDITERRRAEQALQESEARFRSLFENASDLITVLDAAGCIRFQSPSVERVLGYLPEALLGRNAFDWIHPEDAARAQAALARGRHQPPGITPLECRFRHLNGSWVTLQSVGREFPTQGDEQLLVVHSRNVTKQKQLEAQLRESQKMEAIGQLAGGVAHDSNNMLSIIFGHCELLEKALPPKSALSDSVGEILRASERVATLNRQLLAFSRQQVLAPKVVALNGIVAEAETLLRRIIGEDVRLMTVLRPDLHPVRVDPGQIDQVILNLAVNARDAMPRGGALTLETSEVERESTMGKSAPGKYILLTVSDTGTGMTPEIQARIFEPFFTTKITGKGTGLGLSVADGIVKQSGGHIAVESAPGRGTTFKIYLPAVDAEPPAAPAQSAPSKRVGGSETILLAEDEQRVRAMTAITLESLGYRVLQAASGEEAMRLAEEAREKIDLLMTDVVMPGMNGRDLADALRARDPGLKVLFQSGYTGDVVVRHDSLHAEKAFLQKPYRLDALAKKVREVLEQRP